MSVVPETGKKVYTHLEDFGYSCVCFGPVFLILGFGIQFGFGGALIGVGAAKMFWGLLFAMSEGLDVLAERSKK